MRMNYDGLLKLIRPIELRWMIKLTFLNELPRNIKIIKNKWIIVKDKITISKWIMFVD